MRTALVVLISLGLTTPAVLAQDEAKARKPRLGLRATPRIAFSPVRVHLTAELEGGDPSAEYHCPALEWDWDDGSKSAHEADCEPLDESEGFERRFSADHAYATAGVYEVKVKMLDGTRVLAVATARINVRPGPGDFTATGE